jgi:hypothetical protein
VAISDAFRLPGAAFELTIPDMSFISEYGYCVHPTDLALFNSKPLHNRLDLRAAQQSARCNLLCEGNDWLPILNEERLGMAPNTIE